MPEDTPLLLALSGGADSRALLHMLLSLCEQTGAPLAVAHIDHGIRGEESARDREFCRTLAKTHSLPFHLHIADVPALAAAHGTSLEEEARRVRYAFFASVMREHHIPILVTAHNADDNAETVLFRLARGTTARGLCGIPPVRDCEGGRVVRPLLGVTKEEILRYCEENRLAYVTDSTNACTDPARNRIRHHVLPSLRQINGGTVHNITRLCDTLRTDEDFWETETATFLAKNAEARTLAIPPLLALHPALGTRVLVRWLEHMGIEPSKNAIGLSFSLAKNEKPHAALSLVGGTLTHEGDKLVCASGTPAAPSPYQFSLAIGENAVADGTMCLFWEKGDAPHENRELCQNIYKKATKARISFDTIDGSLFVRPRRAHDTILSGGMHKKVKKLLCDKKVPLSLRDTLPILCDESGILWIPGVALRDGAGDDTGDIFTLYYNENS